MHTGPPVWLWFLPIIIVLIGYAIAAARVGKVATASLGSRRLEVHTPADPQTAFDRIAAIGGGKFKVDDKDANAKILVLSSGITFGTWGFLYPVYIHAAGSGSRVEIGCSSKFIQLGPLVTRWHKLCVQAIEEVLAPPAARVA
jgi:hypothetical protein